MEVPLNLMILPDGSNTMLENVGTGVDPLREPLETLITSTAKGNENHESLSSQLRVNQHSRSLLLR